MRNVLVAALVSLIVSLAGTPIAIRALRAKGYGKLIRQDGPTTHHTKRGTPTMGGLVIIAATLAGYLAAHLVFLRGVTASGVLVLMLMTGLGFVGFLDDYIQVRKQRSLGLTAAAKFAGQAVVAIAFGLLATHFSNTHGFTPASTHLSFTRDYSLDFTAAGFVVWSYFMVSATSNGVNLTDGLDGLVAGASCMVFGAYVVIAFWQNGNNCAFDSSRACYAVRDPLDIAIIAAAAMGACFGFLWWNASPARIFMGDTGSLSLGGLLAGIAMTTRTELLLVVLGGLFVIEVLSVIIQVSVFKATRKRVFNMAPFHHHFELAGWDENTVIVRFWIIAGLAVAFGLGVFYAAFLAHMTARYDGLRAVVAGLGVTGAAVADVLLARGADVTVVSDRDGEPERLVAERLRERGARVRLGDSVTPVPADLVVASPGFRPDQPLVAAAAGAGVDVIGEPELAWRLRAPDAAPWLGVTGTNGKTTSVGMLEAVLQAAGLRCVAAGNVGLPLVSAVTAEPAYDVLAVEVSSAQLQWSPSLRFAAAAILNISEDHLDWHDTMDAYVAAKQRIWTDAVAIGNLDDPVVHNLLAAGSIGFSLSDPAADYLLAEGQLRERATGEVLVAVDELGVTGPHNWSNALAAAALARSHGVPVEAVRAGLTGFRPGRHRQERVASGGGVEWVDDSKATNPHAAAASLAAYPSVVWVAGGLLKGADVGPLVAEHGRRLRGVVLLGRDRDQIAAAMARHAPDVPVVAVEASDTGAMDSAVLAAAAMAQPGDVVLLAPAGASWDMFRDYADRGDRFAAAARDVAGRA